MVFFELVSQTVLNLFAFLAIEQTLNKGIRPSALMAYLRLSLCHVIKSMSEKEKPGKGIEKSLHVVNILPLSIALRKVGCKSVAALASLSEFS